MNITLIISEYLRKMVFEADCENFGLLGTEMSSVLEMIATTVYAHIDCFYFYVLLSIFS
jgi:hypothetical protein